MSLRTKFFALTYDRQIAGAEKAGLRAFREALLAGAKGDVIEIGGGTGANLPCYGPAVGSLTITEPQAPMLRRLERRVRQHRPDARVLRAPAVVGHAAAPGYPSPAAGSGSQLTGRAG